GVQLEAHHRRDQALGMARSLPDRDRPRRRDQARDEKEVGLDPSAGRRRCGARRGGCSGGVSGPPDTHYVVSSPTLPVAPIRFVVTSRASCCFSTRSASSSRPFAVTVTISPPGT